MSRVNGIRLLFALLLAAGLAWLVTATEWTEVDVTKPPRGEAAKNRLYALQSVLRTLGATVVKRQNLEAMPPAQARLVLQSRHWDLFPDRGRRLRQWVEQEGGHLVIPGSMVDHRELVDWLPVQIIEDAPKKRSEEAEATRPGRRTGPDRDCRPLAEPDEVAPAYADGRSYRVCVPRYWERYKVAPGRVAEWSLAGVAGRVLVRVAAGRGSVTVVAPWSLLDNANVLRADNALAAVAALQAGKGAQVWFVAEEAREPFFAWLWQQAWPAALLALAALALFLWRGAVRFGPGAAILERHRRSIAEQVGGTAQFLQRHGAASLHAAQLRALNETAARHLRRYPQLDAVQRAQALADATGVERPAIARALVPGARSAADLPADLHILETVRRRLGQDAHPDPSADPSS
jgi:hypothetical protein